MFAGVRGLMVAGKDRRKTSMSDLLCFTVCLDSINAGIKEVQLDLIDKPIWTNLSALLSQTFSSAFASHDTKDLGPTPTFNDLAPAITDDFLNNLPSDSQPLPPFISLQEQEQLEE